MKVYGYLRVSGLGQVDGDGFPRQREAIDRLDRLTRHDIIPGILPPPPIIWVEEKGITGTIGDRPALAIMMNKLEDGDIVIIERLDRLARDLMVQETIIADIRKRGATLISTLEPDLCSDDPSRKLMRQIFGAVAEYDRAMVVAKLKGARDRKRAATGRCEGRAPAEYDPSIIADVHRRFHQGENLSAIARAMNEASILAPNPRQPHRWHPGTVARVLRRKA